MVASGQATGDRRPRPGPRPRPFPVAAARPATEPDPTDVVQLLQPSRRAVLVTSTAGLLVAAGFGGRDLEARPLVAAPAVATADRPAAPARPLAARVVVANRHRRRHHPILRLDDIGHIRPALGPRAVMLTLDDGPHPQWTPRFLRLLEHTGVTATFFMIGSQVHRDPGLVREVAARGHAIGNHTWSHDESLGLRPDSRIQSEIERTSHAIHAACGVVPAQFRAPGGNWAPRLLDILAEQELLPVGWDLDPMDWARPGTRSIVRDLSRIRPHDIALCHDGGGDRSQTFHALEQVIPRLQRRGFTFVTLAGAAGR